VVRNLCAKHNRALSTYDEEAKKLFEGWHKLWIQKESEHFERSHNGQIILKVDGKKIERWLAKTFINCLIFEASLSLHENLTYFPSAQSLVSAIFSDDDFSSPYGLYIVKPWKQMYPNESRRLNWTLKIQHEKTRHYHSEKHIWKDYVLPTFIWVGFAGVEIIGVFNPTVYKNEFHQTCLKQYYESFLPDRADYHQHMIGFNRDNDKDLGPQGPARIIQFEW
ncbi:MAG TPA: hypothetical protein VN457_00035, partial [Chlamydiales bacterium]|nr:hypothetical protein [Chlamydiales bacterium]